MALNVNLTFDLAMTLTLGLRSQNIDKNTHRYYTHLSTKFEANLLSGLGGVWHHTDRHTDRQTHRQMSLRY